MPDLKTEMAKVINEWNQPKGTTMTQTAAAPKPYFTTTNNVCRVTFDCIKANPGKTRTELAAMLEKDGYKKSSVTSLIGQMRKQGMVRDTSGLLFTVIPEYRPIKSAKSWANQQSKAAPKPERKLVTLVSKRTGEILNPKPAPAPVEKEWEPKDVIDKLSVRQALALFKELRNILVS